MESKFDWDAGNLDHVAAHGVSPEEAEEAILDPERVPASAYQVDGERRRALLGATLAGRLLFVVLTQRAGRLRVITARDASARERHRFRRQKR